MSKNSFLIDTAQLVLSPRFLNFPVNVTEATCYVELNKTVQHAINFIYDNNMVEGIYIESWSCRELQTSP